MIEFGSTLRAAREAKGLSTRQLADKTHLLAQQIEALEREDFSRIAAPIYGRGFVKLCCEVLEIEAKPLVDAFMDIYSGNRPPTIRMRENTNIESIAASEEIKEPEVNEPKAPEPVELPFTLEAETVAAKPVHTPPPERAPAFERPQGPSRYATPQPIDYGTSSFKIPPVVWRIGIIVVVAGIFLWLAISGIKAIYSASMAGPAKPATATSSIEATNAPQQNKKPVARTPMKINPLFID
ncbi:MAG: helix-turn-helix domain-containing protein [Kiritimatiellae bacterium]|nr:helix-turn-helix domain-containing protein [Kiritimatiellia bacterium]